MSLQKPGLAHLDRQIATVGEPLPKTFLPCFVLKMFISVVVQLLMVHNCLLIWVRQVDIGYVPLLVPWVQLRCAHLSSTLCACIHFCVTSVCPFTFFWHSLLCWVHSFLPHSFLPLFLCLILPFSCLPLLLPPLHICRSVPKFKFGRGLWGLLYSSLFCHS